MGASPGQDVAAEEQKLLKARLDAAKRDAAETNELLKDLFGVGLDDVDINDDEFAGHISP